MSIARVPSHYSRAEKRSDACVHICGLLLALIATPVLITITIVLSGDKRTVFATAIYAFTLLAMLSCSAVYHLGPWPGWKDRLRRFDQTAIYLKIAGSYTPFAVLAGSPTTAFITVVWCAALIGAGAILFGPAWLRRPSLLLYLAIGWAGLAAGQTIFEPMTPAGFSLIVAGGMLYTLGVVFFLWEKLPHHNTVWHLFVLVATAIVYAAVFVEILARATATSAVA